MKLIKLVRDKIPELYSPVSGVVFMHIPPAELREARQKKLMEEVAEYLTDPSVGELCDIIEIVETLAMREHHMTVVELHRATKDKRLAKGDFESGIGLYMDAEPVAQAR